MTKTASGKNVQLERIARLLDQPLGSLSSDDAGIAILSELLEVWPRLTDDDRGDVLAFAADRAGRLGLEEPIA